MKRLPRWAKVLLIFLVVVIALAAIIPRFLDLDRYRPMIASAIEKETGRKVTIGKMHARLIPSVGFTIEGFSIGNPQGFAEGNLLSAESIRGSLAWGPLFRREFKLSSIRIDHPVLTLLEDDRGNVNHELETPKKPGEKAKADSGFKLADIDSIELKDVELTVARVTGSRKRIVPILRARNINATVEDVALDPNKLKQWGADADLSGVRLDLTGLKGPVEFKSGDLKLSKGAINSTFDIDFAGAGRVKGKLHLPDIEKVEATFELNTGVLDLDKLTAATVKAETLPATPGSRPQKRELVAQGRIAAGTIRWAPYELNNASADIRVYNDGMEIGPVRAAMYGGTLNATARVDSRSNPSRFSSSLKLSGLDVAKALAGSPDTRGKMTGTAEMDLQVGGALGGDLLNSVNGTGRFAVLNGRFPGFNMGGALKSMAKVQQILTFGAGSGGFGGETPFRSLEGDMRIGGGRVASDRIHLDSPSGTVDLRGSFGFDQTLNYDGQAILMKSGGEGPSNPAEAVVGVLGGVMKQTVGRISVPFALRGTFSNMKIQPGRGIPAISTTSTNDTQTQAQPTEEQKKKKSIFDLFRKP